MLIKHLLTDENLKIRSQVDLKAESKFWFVAKLSNEVICSEITKRNRTKPKRNKIHQRNKTNQRKAMINLSLFDKIEVCQCCKYA